MNLKPEHRNILIIVAVVGALALSSAVEKLFRPAPAPRPSPVAASPKPTPVNCPKGEEWGDWDQAGGNMWADVKVYIGPGSCKRPIAVIIGGNSQRVLLRYADGPNWKTRSVVAEELYVKKDDPAIADMKWREIKN